MFSACHVLARKFFGAYSLEPSLMMSRLLRPAHVVAAALGLSALAWVGGAAEAQIGPSQLPPTPTIPDSTSTGVAEQAKADPDTLPTPPVLPPPKSARKRFQMFQLDGYYRFRTDWLRSLNLGYEQQLDNDGQVVLSPPFPRSFGCDTGDADDPCDSSLRGANMRLRLEPVVFITERSSVHMQIDLLDNILLGSTTDGAVLAGQTSDSNIPGTGFADNQVPPQEGLNSFTDAIRIKRAWAEVETSLGHLSFGRQPWHWGMGIFANSGSYDPFSGTYQIDSDQGDTVDRAMFRARIPGTNIDASLASDWGSTTPTAGQTALYRGRRDQLFDIEDSDDVTQWVITVLRFDDPKEFSERMARGEFAFNYGGFLAYRTQGWETKAEIDEDGAVTYDIVRRDLRTYTPDIWFKLGWGKLMLEAEGVVTFGSVDEVTDLEPLQDEGLNFGRVGAVARLSYTVLDGDMRLSAEGGYASGDGEPNTVPGTVHVSTAPLLPSDDDGTINAFQFDPDYHVDLILFRKILGAVSNAIYVKPRLSYQLSDALSADLGAIISAADNQAATPGQGRMYGVEFNLNIGYRSGGFFAGVSGGALFPLSALDLSAISDELPSPVEEATSGEGDGINDEGPGNAYIVQTRLALSF